MANHEELYKKYARETERILATTPSYPDLLNRRGLLNHYFGHHDVARKDFLNALSRNSNYEQAQVNLAFVIAEDDPRGAIGFLSGVAKDSREPCRRFVDLARLCWTHSRTDAAWDAIHHAASLDATNPLPLHWGAYFLQNEKRTREARRWLHRSSRVGGGCVESYELLGVKQRQDLSPERLEETVQSLPRPSGFVEIHLEVARWLTTQQREREAVKELKQILIHDPRFAPYATFRGWMAFLAGMHRRAERWLRKALEYDPEHVRTHEQLAQVYSATDERVRAERHLLKAIELRPNYPDLRYDLALLCTRSDRIEEAVHHLRSCLAIAPAFARARFRLGECYVNLGRPEAAMDQFRLLPEEMKHRPDVSPVIAKCLAEVV